MAQPTEIDEREKSRRGNVLAAFALALTDKINAAMRGVSSRSESSLAALVQIKFNAGISIDQLRAILSLSHSSCVRVVEHLVVENLVARTRSDIDSRFAVLTLTERGEEEADRLLAARADICGRLMQATDVEDGVLAFIEKAMPAIVSAGADQDVVCRFCDMDICTQDRCPVNACTEAPSPA